MTHLITPPRTRTLKTFAASLTSKWIITDYNWVLNSAEAGQFLSEATFGERYTEKPFKVFRTSD